MRLARKHIGGLFDIAVGDGSWCYQLVDVRNKKLLFYTMSGTYKIESNRHLDWRYFKPRKTWPKSWIERGWEEGRVTP